MRTTIESDTIKPIRYDLPNQKVRVYIGETAPKKRNSELTKISKMATYTTE